MFITIDNNNNILRANCPIKMDDNQIEVNEWPIDENGNLISKQLCVWDEENKIVVLKSQSQLDSENALKQLPETDAKISRALEDHVDLLISKGLVSIKDYPEEFQEIYSLKKELRSQIL